MLIIGAVLLIISIILLYVWNSNNELDSNLETFLYIFIFGIILIFCGPLVSYRGFFYRNKISREFSLGELNQRVGYPIGYNDTVHLIMNNLKNNMVEFTEQVKKIYINYPVTELNLHNMGYIIIIEPDFFTTRRRGSRLIGLIISISPASNIQNPEVQKIISLIENSITKP
ncbi:MAG: hypothetical protein KAJ51_10100 [Thermoplasmata archaeon]|nr:hypothetical protein [Thermoplasmata archaeon]